ncbi:pyrroline-5-carboxylate reductase [Cellulomonas fimi]|uniref:Pyrroline-5-carboxylate reductase n=1 Tax=Cellulomonas fimi (strain ATCC 484 / DSM 20113 / JCM 1341 / CCUG 24087 / LMG 16345 / NBRC 15513 / NCIMB 8980 / NCTC 7547 / NRS-133) TaxID=590998 RepID=F4H0N3_CELFA|nr:pyrroline-5-carboxylate reductase [Cellulomonas fimi]AEE45006.1 pyrroline-5-carboxylate reductase [Cellulomonas fimi ATCC 484]NNH09013.1 pyrroline-5-carboxylate reductase [Cellulomonas fimi]VEH27949.1 Pyrroline-5-carboxylate reductase [Cellulomonas fimi]
MTGPADGTPRVAVLGGGVMGEALLSSLLTAGWATDRVEVTEHASARAEELADRYGVRTGSSNAQAAERADVVLVAVKPNVVGAVLDEVAPVLRAGTLVVSVAAGLPLAFYEGRLPDGTPVVRVMPNTPAVVGKGASAIAAGRHADDDHLALVERVLAATGLVVRVAEKDLDAVTAISGSGPAYAFYLIDAMAEAGVLLGLTRDLASRLAVATVEGAAALAAQSGEHPVVLRERVSSPGGTTVAAVAELDAHAVRAGVVAAARAAAERSRQLGAQHGG